MPGIPTNVKRTKTFANTAARVTTLPEFVGQIGVQLDEGSLWRATAMTAGAWTGEWYIYATDEISKEAGITLTEVSAAFTAEDSNTSAGGSVGAYETGFQLQAYNQDDNLGVSLKAQNNGIVLQDIGFGSTPYLQIGGDITHAVLRFQEPPASGSNHTAVYAQAQSANISLVLPSTVGTTGQVLTASVSGSTNTLSWTSHAGAIITTDTTLNVPGTYATIQAALDYLADYLISEDATVTIQVADGTYTIPSGRWNFNHPCGARIQLLGNTSTPANCVLSGTALTGETPGEFFEEDWGAINVNNGNTLGYIDGFRMVGPVSGGHATLYGVAALLAFNGATITTGPNMVIEDFYAGVAAFHGSTVYCDGITVRYGGDGNIFAYNGSFISAIGVTSTNANTWFAQAGLLSEHASSIFAPDAILTDNEGYGAAIHYGASMMLYGSDITGSGGQGVLWIDASYPDVRSISFTGISGEDQYPTHVFRQEPGFTRVGWNTGSDPSLFGEFQFIGYQNTITSLSVTQDNVAGLGIGFKANDNDAYFVTDGDTLRIRINGTSVADFTGGTEVLSMTTSLFAILPSGGNVAIGGGATASELRLLEPSGSGTNYNAFRSGAISDNFRYTLPTTAPTTNQILSASAVSGSNPVDVTLAWATPAGSGSKTKAVFTPLDNQPPAANFATLDTRNSIALLNFDDTTEESAIFVGVMPEGASLGSGLSVIVKACAATATTGDYRFGAQWMRCNTDIDSDSFDTAVEATTTTSGTSGIPSSTTLTTTNIDGITAGDMFRLKIYRDTSDGGDTMAGDLQLLTVEVQTVA